MSTNGNVDNSIELRGSVTIPDSIHGKSAYEIAVYHGFDGTEEEWLESLKGEKDDKGDKPVNGVDYNTSEEKGALAADVADVVVERLYDTILEEDPTEVWLAEPLAFTAGWMEADGTVDNSSTATHKHSQMIDVQSGDILAPNKGNFSGVTAYDYYGNAVANRGSGECENYTVPSGISSVVLSFVADTDAVRVNITRLEVKVKGIRELQAQVEAIAQSLKGRISHIDLSAANWQGVESPYSQVVAIDGVTEYSKIDINPSIEQLAIFYQKDIAFVAENEDGIVTVYCIGQKPTADYQMQITITEVNANG